MTMQSKVHPPRHVTITQMAIEEDGNVKIMYFLPDGTHLATLTQQEEEKEVDPKGKPKSKS